MIKKYIVFLFFIVIASLTIMVCRNVNTYNTSPEAFLKNNPDADIFVLDRALYINAGQIEWVSEMDLYVIDAEIGKILRTGVRKGFKDFDATKLQVASKIYRIRDKNDILVVKTVDEIIPYLKWVEG